ncbi:MULTISPECIES: LysR family transcriptional regulator [unclassified Rhizobium]|uniref:LysR family transcriptional regulator n=1 Tax=unclassified Rhizobium TaxID=2613769 RepID=UPI00104F8165|nr:MULTISPECIES: LysR family transcriptional regulator [unclassified Rhizobium]MBB3395474.1 DNA-binding transcriptional LysR family regulator [Rhizobium sp. BK060]MBB4168845.1 DNA-binding transcriptional LysR family regulator [Rhizobium sp. BK538]TCM75149.1 LysR family transcriptional regulator [Rhizobium sp. BK068]
MPRDQINELTAFLAVARERSFTRAAAELGVTPSALSHTIKGLEERLGLRLLSRTTRNVAPTEAGERLQRQVGPLFEQIATEIDEIGSLRDRPAGTIRITCTDAMIETIFRPRLGAFLQKYPDVRVELDMNYALVDIVAERFDAGVRIGEALEKDMVATRIGPDWRFSVVGSPGYFARHAPPVTPQDLREHNCINIRLSASGGTLKWEFRSPEGRDISLRVEGQATFNTSGAALIGAVDGLGLGWIPQEFAAPYLADGRLIEVLSDWCPSYEGYHLYYPSRKQHSPAFAAFVDAMCYRGPLRSREAGN